MKVNILDAHDRLLHYQKQAEYITQGCEDCIKNRPKEFENYPFYIFAHKRTVEPDERISIYSQDVQMSLRYPSQYTRKYPSIENVPSTRIIWVPRLTKPEAQENSMLFRNTPPGGDIEVIWVLVDSGMENQSIKGNMTESESVITSTKLFRTNRGLLEKKEDGDVSEERAKEIYRQIAYNKANQKRLLATPKTSEVFQALSL